MIVIYLLFTAFALCTVHVLLNYNKKARMLNKIPGPRGVFIVGNGIDIMLSPVELFKWGRVWSNKWKGIYRIWAYPLGLVNIYNPEDIEIVTSTMKHSAKSIFYTFMKPWLQDGLLLSSGTKWHHRRKILTQTFHFNILGQFYVVLEENTRRLVDNINTVLGGPVDVAPIISEFTLNSICETAMGVQLNTKENESGKSYKEAICSLITLLIERMTKTHLYFDLPFNLSTIGRNQKTKLTTIHGFTKSVINKRKIDFGTQNTNIVEDDEYQNVYFHSKKRMAMLDLLISAEKDGLIDEVGIQEEVDTFMFEGHDTTAAGLIFCLMMLANNTDVQNKVIAELEDILGDDSQKSITMEDLSKMQYMDRCIKESMRLYPPVPFISRIISETVKLSNYTIPEGTVCLLNIYDMHRRDDLFKNPLEFDPDRFLPENCVSRHPYAYIPFSAGPRNCIGQKFAIMEMKSAIAAILRNYSLLPVTRPVDLEFKADLVLRNNGPVYVEFVKRT